MPFHQVGVPAGSHFKHILSGRTFILERHSISKRLILTLYHQNADGQKTRAGYLKAASKFDKHLALDLLDSNSHFSVIYMRTDDEYRNISLGAMLMFIIVREVQVNGGVYLYLRCPVLDSLGFYCQFGFYPAPENVEKQYFEALEDIREIRRKPGQDFDDLEIQFQDKIRMSRGFSL